MILGEPLLQLLYFGFLNSNFTTIFLLLNTEFSQSVSEANLYFFFNFTNQLTQSRKKCRFWKPDTKSGCRKGDQCEFIHDSTVASAASATSGMIE